MKLLSMLMIAGTILMADVAKASCTNATGATPIGRSPTLAKKGMGTNLVDQGKR